MKTSPGWSAVKQDRKGWVPLLAVGFGVVLLVLLWLGAEGLAGRAALRRYEAALERARSARTEAREGLATSPEEDGAPAWEALAQLGAPPWSVRRANQRAHSGGVLVTWRLSEWYRRRPDPPEGWERVEASEYWKEVAASLAERKAALEALVAALQKPRFSSDIDPKKTIEPERYFQTVRASRWLRAAILLALREGRREDASRFLEALIRTPLLIVEDAMLVSDGVRRIAGVTAWDTTWQALQLDGWSDDDLARWQRAWESNCWLVPKIAAMENEKFQIFAEWDRIRHSGPSDVIGVMEPLVEDPPDWLDPVVYHPAVKGLDATLWLYVWSYGEQSRRLRFLEDCTALLRDAEKHRNGLRLRSELEAVSERYNPRSFYERLHNRFSDYRSGYQREALEAMELETDRSLVLAALALERYRLRHGVYPGRLEELVPEFLPEVPIDFMDGKPIRYRRRPDGSFVLYSVGWDGLDGGGDPSIPPGSKLPLRWEWPDVDWPRPATEAEVEAYWRERLKRP